MKSSTSKVGAFNRRNNIRHAFAPLLAAACVFSAALLPFARAAGVRPLGQQTEPPSTTAPAPNSDPVYQQLRNITAGGKAIAVKDFVLKRDAGTFTFKSGTFIFLTPVLGKTTGAVFIGSAVFFLDPPIPSEKHSLQLLTKSPTLLENFSAVVLRFTDGTEAEIESKGTPPAGEVVSSADEILQGIQYELHNDIEFNLDARILQDVLSPEPGGFFCAFLKDGKYGSTQIYVLDPHGIPAGFLSANVAPEEVAFSAFSTYAPSDSGVWASFHYSDEYAQGTASSRQLNYPFAIPYQNLDLTIDKRGLLTGVATAKITALANGVCVVPLRLFPTLRVSSVTSEDHQPLNFIQEDWMQDFQFSVILPRPLAAGENFTFTTTYRGPSSYFDPHAIGRSSWGFYYLRARTSWYPNSYSPANYATYDLTFHVPREFSVIATGSQASHEPHGDFDVSQWHTAVPIPEASFAMGDYKRVELKLSDPDVTLENYWHPDSATRIINLTAKTNKILAEAELGVPLYTDFFGPTPYNRLALTQQAPGPRSFATLIFLPRLSYSDVPLSQILIPHDTFDFPALDTVLIAHQWWGNSVGQISYRDQWMGEGFAEFSASLFFQTFYKDGSYDKFWEEQRYLLTQKDAQGLRWNDEGPITQGNRLMTLRGGFRVPSEQIFAKGAYILQMIRFMMWNSETQDADFKRLMHDFVQAYTNRPATTEDFKLAVEQHMIPAMDLAGDGKMDWFFDEYVYGTAFPNEKFSYSFSTAPDGAPILNFKIVQSKVDSNFRMIIPVYIQQPDGTVLRVATVPLTGNATFENQIPLTGPKPKRALINYFHDVLCTQN